MKESLNEAVAALRPEMTAALQRLVRKKSVEGPELPGKPFGADVDACFTEVLTLCRELGFETTDLDRYIGWCEIGSGDEMVAMLGHLDVVPEGEGWHHPPYGAEIVDGRLFGRGAIDDKGPVVASLFALKAIRDLNIPLRRRVRLLFGLNEETNDRDVFYYRDHGGEIPVLGFTPDGEYPLINGEKGILNESYAVQLHQTGAWKLVSVRGGVAGNVVPDYACAVLTAPAGAALPDAEHITVTAIPGGYQVEAVGVSAHGSHPEQGQNAIGRLALLYVCAVMPFMAYSTFVNQLYQCLGFKVPATVLASLRQGICYLPLIFILPHFLGLQGVQMTQPGSDLLTFFICIPFQIVFFRKHLRDNA